MDEVMDEMMDKEMDEEMTSGRQRDDIRGVTRDMTEEK